MPSETAGHEACGAGRRSGFLRSTASYNPCGASISLGRMRHPPPMIVATSDPTNGLAREHSHAHSVRMSIGVRCRSEGLGLSSGPTVPMIHDPLIRGINHARSIIRAPGPPPARPSRVPGPHGLGHGRDRPRCTPGRARAAGGRRGSPTRTPLGQDPPTRSPRSRRTSPPRRSGCCTSSAPARSAISTPGITSPR